MRYPGGKGKCFQQLINQMPPHTTYIETHLGGGAVLRHKKAAARNIGIDIDDALVARWQARGDTENEYVIADAVTFLESFAFSGHELVYADPPYMLETRRRSRIYRYEYNNDDHARLLAVLKGLPCMVMVSGYDHPYYETALSGWRSHRFQAKTHTDVRQETIWMNYSEPASLHDTRYLGNSFRERQGLQRRRNTLHRRVENMDVTERTAFFRWMAETYGSELEGVPCNVPM
jgi:DNA adenine methylase